MKRTFAAALAVLALMSAPSQAQFTDANDIVRSIGTSQFIRAAERVSRASSARVEKLSTFFGASRASQRLIRAEALNESDLAYLRRNLMLNPIVMIAIRWAGVEVSQIVALWIDGNGAAILYADDL